jgi:hypothetical protein
MKWFVLLLALATVACASERLVIGGRGAPPRGWDIDTVANMDQEIKYSIQLTQCNLAGLEAAALAVSDPKHPSYRNFMTVDEVNALTMCPENVHGKKVAEWLAANGATFVQLGSVIRVVSTVKIATELFETDFYEFINLKNENKMLIRQLGEFSIPAELSESINLVTGISEFFHDTKYKATPSSFTSKAKAGIMANPVPGPNPANISDVYITPALLRRTYNISTIEPGTSNFQGVAAFDDYYDATALCQFQTAIMQDFDFVPTIIYKGFQPSSEYNTSADEVESDLDIQYITGLGRGITTLFYSQEPGYWILDWANSALQMFDNGPYVWSISYGWPELWECAAAPFNVTTCPTGYSSQDYVNATNTELSKFALLGVSVMVASGDDGAPGFSYNAPLDPNSPQPTGYSCANTLPGVASCGCATVVITTNNGSRCVFPIGIEFQLPECIDLLYDQDCATAFEKVSNTPSCHINSSFSGNGSYPYFYSDCQCTALQNATVGTCTVAGFSKADAMNYPSLFTDFPTSSPWVTSVGATQFQIGFEACESNMIDQPEQIVSGTTFAYSSGGGFAMYSEQPTYQANAVNAYLKIAGATPPQYAFPTGGRAYPDVAFNGHNFVTVLGLIAAADELLLPTADFGTIEEIQGTSASSPSFAGMVSLLNSWALANPAKGKKPAPLGFLNPLLYTMAAEQPNTFNDIVPVNYPSLGITIAQNNCSRFGCSEFSYSAAVGWDATSGLGTPNFGNIISYLSNMNGVSANADDNVTMKKKN